MKETQCEDMENKILGIAKKLFIEKGYTETNMSEIALHVGINRPGLHYYFRTKERMFQAVFSQIVLSFLPEIKEIILRKDLPISQRIGYVIDSYYDRIFKENPHLPLFMVKEINRDVDHLLATIRELRLDALVKEIAASLEEEMAAGQLKTVPLQTVFLTFYSLLITPCLSKNMISLVLMEEGESFDDLLHKWKYQIIRQMELLLKVD